MSDFLTEKKLNENNLQAPFQYKVSSNEFELKRVQIEIELKPENNQVKVFEGESLFCADLGYSIDGDYYSMNFYVGGVKVFPSVVKSIKELKDAELDTGKIYLVEDINFKSIVYLYIQNLNKVLTADITTYNSVLSSWMFDETAKKLNLLDTNFPIKNFYPFYDYKVNDIIKKDGYLYKVIKDFRSTKNEIFNCILITPFKQLEDSNSLKMYDLVQSDNQFFIVNDNDNSLKPLTDVISWGSGIKNIYKNQIIIKDNKRYLVLEDVYTPVFDDLIQYNKIIDLYNAENIYIATGESVSSELKRIETKIDNETDIRIEEDKKIDDKIKTETNNRIEEDNKLIEEDKRLNKKIEETRQSSIYIEGDNIKINSSFLILKPAPIEIDKKSPIMLADNEDSIEINILSDSDIKIIDFIASNMEYDLQGKKITIKKTDTAGEYIQASFKIKASKQSDNQYYYEDSILQVFINNPIYNTELELANNIIEVKPKSEASINITSNADNIECKTDNDNIKASIENTGTGKALKIINNSTEEEKAVIEITAGKEASENKVYIDTVKKLFVNGAQKIAVSDINTDGGLNKEYIENNTYLINDLIIRNNKLYKVNENFTASNWDADISKLTAIGLDLGTADAVNVTQTNEALGANVQTALNILDKRYMLPCYYEQLTDDNGNFLEEEEPANWYLALYGITTVWELVHNTKSVVFRTEGNKASVGRVNGLQPYGMQNLSGSINGGHIDGPIGIFINAIGVCSINDLYNYSISVLSNKNSYINASFNSNKQIREYTNDIVVDNLLVRKWKLVSINGILISDLLNKGV